MTETKKEEKRPTIWEAIPLITGDVAPIAKARKNQQQGYSFRGIDDVYAALNLLLAKYGVSILPKVLESAHDSFPSKSGGTMFRHRIRVQYKLVASDGSHEFAESEGEGMDSGDKATPKAFSTAFKTMAFEVFCIPTGEKIDSEEDSPEVAPATPTKSNGKRPEQTQVVDPIEQKAAALIEKCEAGFKTAEEKLEWKAKHREEINHMPQAFKGQIVAAFEKSEVRS